MAQGWPDNANRQASSTPYHKVSAASTNADTIKASAGVVTGYHVGNNGTAIRYVKLYNLAANPTVGTSVPVVTLLVPKGSGANIPLDPPLGFDVGIAIAITANMADSDATAVAANEVVANIFYQ
jgi:hypothetical protein